MTQRTPVPRACWASGLLFSAVLLLPSAALALQPPQDEASRSAGLARGFQAVELQASPSLQRYAMGSKRAGDLLELQGFFARHSRDWDVQWDERSDRPHLVQGAGIPLIPGKGNDLSRADVGLGAFTELQAADLEPLLRDFMDQHPELFRVAQEDLVLDAERSVGTGKDRYFWNIEFQQTHRGVPVEGASVFFRVNNGNIVQFGNDKIGDITLDTQPRLTRGRALRTVLRAAGFRASEISEWVQRGKLKIYPVLEADEPIGEPFVGQPGDGYRHRLAWEFIFRRTGEARTYKAIVDALNGETLQLTDINAYATVTGGIYPVTNTDPEVVRPFAFATLTNGTTKITDAAGVYSYTGGTATVTLNGQYFQMSDACGSISLSNSTDGNLNFGTSGGTDCTTPGVGGAGNTHASRSGFYHLTNINRKAVSFLTGNSWLNSKVTSNMNINLTCNAFWNGSTVNFYRSGGGCSNTGELAAVFLHEWGHGMDTNSGGAASENGSGEAVGDTFAFLETKDPCIGHNFLSTPCANCTTCTGVRDVSVFGLGGPRTIARPSTIADNNGINCDRYTCPYSSGITPYRGPMGYQGHCESHIASSANWDLAESLVAQHGETAGWAAMDKIWYASLVPSKSAYRLVSGGTCNPSAVVDGCGAQNWYTVFLPADDDNGNLADGTPNACRIWDAFDAHGIACGARPACSGGGPPPTPGTPTATPTPAPPTATPTPIGSTTLQNGVPVTGISGATGSEQFYTLQVPSGASNLSFTTTSSGTDYDADLYVRFGTPPTTTTYDCRSIASTNTETCNMPSATVGTWYVLVHGYSAYSGVTLTGSHAGGGPTSTPTITPVPPTATRTNTPALPTSTPTITPVPPTATRTNTPVPPTATPTNIPGGALNAVYDSVLRAPKCGTVGVSCDSGTLVNGRDGKGPEPNTSNTINATCTDGTSGTYHVDESNDRIKVSTVDGTNFGAGKTVRIEATVWAYSGYTADKLDLYRAANANSPSWVLVGTLTPTVAGAQTLSATYTLPAGSLQAVRAQFRYQGTASSACRNGGYNDRDDLIFAVQ